MLRIKRLRSTRKNGGLFSTAEKIAALADEQKGSSPDDIMQALYVSKKLSRPADQDAAKALNIFRSTINRLIDEDDGATIEACQAAGLLEEVPDAPPRKPRPRKVAAAKKQTA